MYFHGGYRRHTAGSALTSLVLFAIIVPIELCTDHGYNTHHSRSAARVPDAVEVVTEVEPHMAGAFYPDEHPELASRPPQGHPLSYVPYVSAGLGGLAVFLLVGSGAFFVLGVLGSEPEHVIDLDGPA